MSALKSLAAFAAICAAVVVLASRAERRVTPAPRADHVQTKAQQRLAARFRPKLAVAAAVSFVAISAIALLVGPLTANETPADLPVERAGAIAPVSNPLDSGTSSSLAQSDPNGALPEGVNGHWFRRARLIEIKYKLGGLFVRQMMQESSFSDEVIYGQRASWAGAEGIAQIMREYHPWVNPLKPEAALDYAARHMLDLLLRFDGNIVKALAAYNAGAGTVQQAEEEAGSDWLQWMPWETQEYISAIMLPGEQASIPNWEQVKRWWSRNAERIERPLQLRLLQGRTIAVGAQPPAPPPADVAAVGEAAPTSP